MIDVTDAEVRIERPKTCILISLKTKSITEQGHHYRIFRKFVNLCIMGENQLYTRGRSFSLLVLKSNLDF